MNGDPLYHGIALAAGTLLVLPLALAVLNGWTPRGLRGPRPAVRPYAWALLSLYAVMPLNAVPRMIDAPSGVVMACTGLGFGFVVVAATCFLHAERASRRVNPRAES
ncbi:hypothetical protein OHA91_06095 [Streptomyces erythrochromogenes]|uniref:Uncharacterized protein n=1 Tax=Streptomyces erythrochromogenes TaxID=285574 RepID=A0ABZ1Q5W3_9ACTN|nr:hypothetical protein [Streptomyces erythrochromogenes]